MEDILPALLEQIQKEFERRQKTDQTLIRLRKLAEANDCDYSHAHSYAQRLGNLLSAVLSEYVDAGSLPDGKLYYNIISRLLEPTLTRNFDLTSEFCTAVQQILNDQAGIGLKVQQPKINNSRLKGLIDKASGKDYEEVGWVLDNPIENFTQSIVDDFVKTNADFHYKAGYEPVIRRVAASKCCEWCTEVAGVYAYEQNMNRDVFRRHQNCRCTTEYIPDKRKKEKQDVWTKRWD